MKFGKCWKCGAIAKTESKEFGVCVSTMPVRISGICGGGFEEINENEYNKQLEKFNNPIPGIK
jgi:hypothetical protein